MWGGPPGPQPTPSSACGSRGTRPGQGGRPPHFFPPSSPLAPSRPPRRLGGPGGPARTRGSAPPISRLLRQPARPGRPLLRARAGPLHPAGGIPPYSRRRIPTRSVSRRSLLPYPGGGPPVRPRQVRRISDLPFERNPEGLLRRAQRSLRRRFPQAVLPPGAGPPGVAPVLGVLPLHPRAGARRRPAAARPGADRLAPPLPGQNRDFACVWRNLITPYVLQQNIGRILGGVVSERVSRGARRP